MQTLVPPFANYLAIACGGYCFQIFVLTYIFNHAPIFCSSLHLALYYNLQSWIAITQALIYFITLYVADKYIPRDQGMFIYKCNIYCYNFCIKILLPLEDCKLLCDHYDLIYMQEQYIEMDHQSHSSA